MFYLHIKSSTLECLTVKEKIYCSEAQLYCIIVMLQQHRPLLPKAHHTVENIATTLAQPPNRQSFLNLFMVESKSHQVKCFQKVMR